MGRAELRAFLEDLSQAWIDDPANVDPRFERARLRAAACAAGAPELDTVLAHTAMAARSRRQAEAAVDALLGTALALHPEGYGELALAPVRLAPFAVAAQALRRICMTIGGRDRPIRQASITRLCQALFEGKSSGQTVAGCRIIVRGDDTALFAREEAAVTDRRRIAAGATVHWDGRFRITGAGGGTALTIAALGRRRLISAAATAGPRLPSAVRATLPALYDAKGVIAVPHLGWRRKNGGMAGSRTARIQFFPPRPLTSPGFNLA
jgi:tRNA(Ile)-lysidine synthase